jgi:Leucine-rich repeat (LRR) protein
MGKDDVKQGDLVNQELIDKVKKNGGRKLDFYNLSRDVKQKLRDEHVISIIDNHCKTDEVTVIFLYLCVGITDATLSHIATNCTQLKELNVEGCFKITDDGIKAIVEKIGNNLTNLTYGYCSGCTDAALQAVVKHCPNLEYLNADKAGITHIPESIGQDMQKLSSLLLSYNRIERLPPSITLLVDTLDHFHISGNPLQHPPLDIANQGIYVISTYFTPSRPKEKIDLKTSLPTSYQRDFPLVSVQLNNSGDVSLDYNAKGKIQWKIHSIQHVDEKGTLLSTDVFGEDTKYDLTGTYSTADKEEKAHDLLFTGDNILSGEEKISAGEKKPSSES